MGRLALVAGSSLRGVPLPAGDWEALQRHGDAAPYVLPHRIDHVSNLRSLAAAGCDRVLALSSVGSLREDLTPGTLLVPDDFIALGAAPLTALEGEAAHTAPGFDVDWRARVVAQVREAGEEVRDGGVYWQTPGPRFETPAEVRVLAPHADVVGMTVASECAIAAELGLRYAALCIVDNLANGIGAEPLGLERVQAERELGRARLMALLAILLPRLASA